MVEIEQSKAEDGISKIASFVSQTILKICLLTFCRRHSGIGFKREARNCLTTSKMELIAS